MYNELTHTTYEHNPDKPYALYWLHLKSDMKDPMSSINVSGYVGVTRNLKQRIRLHRSQPKGHLKEILKSNKEEDLGVMVLRECENVEEATLFEHTLRPESNVGWNVYSGGGGLPTDASCAAMAKAAKARYSDAAFRKLQGSRISKGVMIVCPDGTIQAYTSHNAASEALNTTPTTISVGKKRGTPITKGPLKGYTILPLLNTHTI